MTVQENDKVKTLVEKDGFPSGIIGVVVSVYGQGPGCEVEIWDEDENPIDVVTFKLTELEKVD